MDLPGEAAYPPTWMKDWTNEAQEKANLLGGREDLNNLAHSLVQF